MNHRDVQHVQSQGQMNGFPLEIHRAIWGTWEDNATKTPPSFKPSEGKICTALSSSSLRLQCNVLRRSWEVCIFSLFPVLRGISVHCAARGGRAENGILCAPKDKTQ